MQIHLVSAVHPVVPGLVQSAYLDPTAADAEAQRLVALIAEYLDTPVTAPADPASWRDYLRAVQLARIEESDGAPDGELDDEDLDARSGCYVEITVLAVPDPRVVVRLDGGLVQDILADVEIDAYVVDYDTEGADEDRLMDVPERGGGESEAYVRGEAVEVEPDLVGRIISAFDAHDGSDDAQADEPEEEEVEA